MQLWKRNTIYWAPFEGPFHFVQRRKPTGRKKKKNKAGDFFFSMGEITEMLKYIKDNGM